MKILDNKNIRLDYKIYDDKPNEPKNNLLYHLIEISGYKHLIDKFIEKIKSN